MGISPWSLLPFGTAAAFGRLLQKLGMRSGKPSLYFRTALGGLDKCSVEKSLRFVDL